MQSSFGVDPVVLIARVPCPILILQGTKDIEVLPADTPRLVQAAQNAHRDVTVVMVQDDDHLFLKLPTRRQPVANISRRHISIRRCSQRSRCGWEAISRLLQRWEPSSLSIVVHWVTVEVGHDALIRTWHRARV